MRWAYAGAAVAILALSVFATSRYMAAEQAQQQLAEERADHLGTRVDLDKTRSDLEEAEDQVEALQEQLDNADGAGRFLAGVAKRSQEISEKLKTCIASFAMLTDEIKAVDSIEDVALVETHTAGVRDYCGQALREQEELDQVLASLGYAPA